MKRLFLTLTLFSFLFSCGKKELQTPVISGESQIVEKVKAFLAGQIPASTFSTLNFGDAFICTNNGDQRLLIIPGEGNEYLYMLLHEDTFLGTWVTLSKKDNKIISLRSKSLDKTNDIIVNFENGRIMSYKVLKGIIPGNSMLSRITLIQVPPVITLSYQELILLQMLGVGQPGWGDNNTAYNNTNFEYLVSSAIDPVGGNNPLPEIISVESTDCTPDQYPGKDQGFPYLWWEDELWLDNNFKLNVDPDQYSKLTAQEKMLVRIFPASAYRISLNISKANQETIARFGVNGLNDKSDAFRHAYFQAINCLVVLPAKVQLFADAHESEVPFILSLEKEMDLFNNSVGIAIGSSMIPFLGSNTSASSKVWDAKENGELKYLAPLNLTLSPPWNANCGNCGNGIVPGVTHLVPSNQ
jgi:hypothetical protein